jgi:hypothetical protein
MNFHAQLPLLGMQVSGIATVSSPVMAVTNTATTILAPDRNLRSHRQLF